MIVHAPNMDHIRQEAERVAIEAKKRGDIQRYEWKQGDNIFRLLPSYGAHGRLFRKVSNHWELPGKRFCYCILDTWPSKTSHCPVCDAIDKLLAMLPELDLRRLMPAPKYDANVIDRKNPGKGVQIVAFTPAVYNWIVTEMNTTAGDITDLEKGIDLKVVLGEKARKQGKGTIKSYDPTWIPRPAPLSEDDAESIAWLEGIFDLDKIRPYPDDAKIAEIHQLATVTIAHYVKRSKDLGDGGESDPGGDEPPPHSDEEAPPPKRARSNGSSQSRTNVSAKQEQKAEVAKPKAQETKHPTKKETTKPTATLEGVDPRSVPPCFAGLEAPEAHDGDDVPDEVKGTYGFSEQLEKCLICEHELRCLDLKHAKGL